MLKFEVSQSVRSTLAAPQVFDVVIALFGLSLQVQPNLKATDIHRTDPTDPTDRRYRTCKLCSSVSLWALLQSAHEQIWNVVPCLILDLVPLLNFLAILVQNDQKWSKYAKVASGQVSALGSADNIWCHHYAIWDVTAVAPPFLDGSLLPLITSCSPPTLSTQPSTVYNIYNATQS